MNILAEKARTAAVLDERNRIAREIHDTLAQGFTGIMMQLKAAEEILGDAPLNARQHVATAKELARTSLTEARRSVNALRPAALEHRSLAFALAESITRATRDTGVTFNLEVSGDEHKLDEHVENNLLRIAQEAFSNLMKHSRAKTVRIELNFGHENVQLVVTDDGVGFNPAEQRDGSHFGLQVMQERAKDIGGDFQATSSPGSGTKITVTIPAVLQQPERR
jgi:signal transduction histidine kinase